MQLRISNGHSYVVEFEAGDEPAFRRALARAFSEYVEHGERSGELHVATDQGEWMSPLYPESNAPLHVGKFLGRDEAARVWALCERSNNRGTWFWYELQRLGDFVAEPGEAIRPQGRPLGVVSADPRDVTKRQRWKHGEWAQIEAAAEREGVTPSEFIRRAALAAAARVES